MIQLEFDTGTPASFMNPIEAAVSELNAVIMFPGNATVTIGVGYGNWDGTTLPSYDLAQGGATEQTPISYAQLRVDLAAGAQTAVMDQFVLALPLGSSDDGQSEFFLAPAQDIAFGINPELPTGIDDGYVGFQTDLSGSQLQALALNEISHALGRLTYGNGVETLGDFTSPGNNQYSPGYTSTTFSYFSLDGGLTSIAPFDYGSGADDTQFNLSGDAFGYDATSPTLSPLDITMLDTLGFNVGTNDPIPAEAPEEIAANLTFATTDGTIPVLGINESTVIQDGAVSADVPDSSWHIVDATGDFGGYGHNDLLWQTSGGAIAIWEMNGDQIENAAYTTDNGAQVGVPAPGWDILGVEDFFGHGDIDILWQTDNGSPAIWEMSGTSVINAGYTMIGSTIIGAPDLTWHIVGAGDFSGIGQDAILWRTDSGALAEWQLNGTQITSAGYLNEGGTQVNAPGADWHIIATGDFAGSGNADILWQTNSGALAIWEMQGTDIIGANYLTDNGIQVSTPSNWDLVGAADINNSGKESLLFQTPSGQMAYWNVSGTEVTGAGYLNLAGAQHGINLTGMTDGTLVQHSFQLL